MTNSQPGPGPGPGPCLADKKPRKHSRKKGHLLLHCLAQKHDTTLRLLFVNAHHANPIPRFFWDQAAKEVAMSHISEQPAPCYAATCIRHTVATNIGKAPAGNLAGAQRGRTRRPRDGQLRRPRCITAVRTAIKGKNHAGGCTWPWPLSLSAALPGCPQH